jgi:hypothetical protein
VRQDAFSVGSSMILVVTFIGACSAVSDDTIAPAGAGGTTGSGTNGRGASSGTGTSSSTTGSGSGGSTGAGTGGGSSDPCLAGTSVDNLENQSQWTQWKINKDTSGGTITPSTTFAAETSPDGNGFAAHVKGSGFTLWGAGLLRSFDPTTMCVAKSKGIKFRAKGPGTITFAAPVRQVLPPIDGGTCMVAADCYNGHETTVTMTASWADYSIDWTRLVQPQWGPRFAFSASDVLQLLFTARVENQPFDFWLDDLVLVGGTSGGPGPGVDAGPSGSCVLDGLLGQTTFNGWFPNRNSVYTYAGLCTALQKPGYASFAKSGDTTTDKREVAAFFAHVAWETGNLVFTDQQQKDPATGRYWGRGPLQLTWDYNYAACGGAIGADLTNSPELVSTDPVITWETALWFWLRNDSGKGFTSHDAIGRGNFGDTLRVINSIECVAGNSAQQARIDNYTRYCAQLMVDPGTQLTCQ